MSRYSEKVKYGNDNESSKDNYIEGTSARTRPFSLQEIMLSRKNKKLSADVKEETGKVRNIIGDDIVLEVSHPLGSDKGQRNNEVSPPTYVKNPTEDNLKGPSRKKESNSSVKEDSSVKRKHRETHVETKSKAKLEENLIHKSKVGDINKQSHGRRKDDERSGNISEFELGGRHFKNSFGKERNGNSSKAKSERDHQKNQRNGGEQKNSGDVENDFGRKQSKNLVSHEKYGSSSHWKYERESKRKHGNEDEEKSIDRNTLKKRGIGKHLSSESERRERRELPEPRHEEEPRSKRRRSRSREHKNDRDRRLVSPSPRTYRRSPRHGQDQGELLTHSSIDRSGGKHSAADRNRISNNGSSSHYRGHCGSTSRLGGYSPRKRRSEAAVKTPSPTNRFPDKKSAGWDLTPAKTDNLLSGSAPSEPINKPSVDKSPITVPVTLSTMMPPLESFSNSLLSRNNASMDPVQLTQSTRPMRRLYVENVPASASEKALMECINGFLLSSGANCIQEAVPCISCIIHKEKGQALVEFLTPEDASAALSFDGGSFSGTILKIRRPKDYAKTGVLEDPVTAVEAISSIVEDSPHKIFVGGISEALSSKMLMEIANAFGPLKAYHFEFDNDLGERRAFLEYVEQSVTVKACLALNGMKLGGQVLTAVQATPSASLLELNGSTPSYDIPEHSKPLLEKPTEVLMLKNVFNQECLVSLSEPDIEETLEDVRLECARFGTVKFVNMIRYNSNCTSSSKVYTATDGMGSEKAGEGEDFGKKIRETENSKEISGHDSEGNSRPEFLSVGGDVIDADVIADKSNVYNEPSDDIINKVASEPDQRNASIAMKDKILESSETLPDQLNSAKDEADVKADLTSENDNEADYNSERANEKLPEAIVWSDGVDGKSSGVIEKGDSKEHAEDTEGLFEQGCVLVEFGRIEASCMAAHCLHGRLFDDRIISVRYVSRDVYRQRFPK